MSAIAGLPDWVIYVALGGLFGAAFAALGYVLEKFGVKFGRYASVLGIVVSLQVTRLFVIPMLEYPRLERALNADLPKRLDEITVLDAATIDGRQLTYSYLIDDYSAADLDISEIKRTQIVTMCDIFWQYLASGYYSRLQYEYTFHDGRRSFFLTSVDCQP